MAQQYGDTMTEPGSDITTQRYEEARAAARRAMTNVSLIPDRPLPPIPTQPEKLAYRGFKFGAAFFGWLIAIAMTVLLTGIAIGAGVGASYVLDYTRSDAEQQAGTAAITIGAILVLLMSLAFYTGGYVAGRLARFDGGRQGFGVWMISLLLAVVAAGAGAILNGQYDLIGRVDRPDVPLTNDTLTTGSIIVAAALVVMTLLFALLGGKTGQRYHDKIDDLLD